MAGFDFGNPDRSGHPEHCGALIFPRPGINISRSQVEGLAALYYSRHHLPSKYLVPSL